MTLGAALQSSACLLQEVCEARARLLRAREATGCLCTSEQAVFVTTLAQLLRGRLAAKTHVLQLLTRDLLLWQVCKWLWCSCCTRRPGDSRHVTFHAAARDPGCFCCGRCTRRWCSCCAATWQPARCARTPPPTCGNWCACNEFKKTCRVFTEAWPPSLAWVDGAPMVSHELAPCPAAPHFRMQFFHIYASWNLEPNTADNWALLRGAACAHPNSLVYVGGAPPHPQRETQNDPEIKMNAPHAVRCRPPAARACTWCAEAMDVTDCPVPRARIWALCARLQENLQTHASQDMMRAVSPFQSVQVEHFASLCATSH